MMGLKQLWGRIPVVAKITSLLLMALAAGGVGLQLPGVYKIAGIIGFCGCAALAVWMLVGTLVAPKDDAIFDRVKAEMSRSSDKPLTDEDHERLQTLQEKLIKGLTYYRDKIRRDSSGGQKVTLYSQPWFLLAGPTGSGKTTMLEKSQLEFFDADSQEFLSGDKLNVPGVGGTHMMDWWFGRNAVMLDTAGGILTQDTKAWEAFLKTLKEVRPAYPINGLMLCLDGETIRTQTAKQFDDDVIAPVRRGIDMIRNILKVRFPVYIILTKCDRIPGFDDVFAEPGDVDNWSHQVVGWSDPMKAGKADKARAGRASTPKLVDNLRGLLRNMKERRDAFLATQTKRDGIERADAIDEAVLLPNAFEQKIIPRLQKFIEKVIPAEVGDQTFPVFFRGVYFTSSLSQGIAIDDDLLASFGNNRDELMSRLEQMGAGAVKRDTGLFIHDLIANKVTKEAGLVATTGNIAQEDWRRSMIAIVSTAVAAVLGLLITSYGVWSLHRQIGGHSDSLNTLATALSTDNREDFLDKDKSAIIDKNSSVLPSEAMKLIAILRASQADFSSPIYPVERNLAEEAREDAAKLAVEVMLLKPLAQATYKKLESSLPSEENSEGHPWDQAAVDAASELFKLAALIAPPGPKAKPAAIKPEQFPSIETLLLYASRSSKNASLGPKELKKLIADQVGGSDDAALLFGCLSVFNNEAGAPTDKNGELALRTQTKLAEVDALKSDRLKELCELYAQSLPVENRQKLKDITDRSNRVELVYRAVSLSNQIAKDKEMLETTAKALEAKTNQEVTNATPGFTSTWNQLDGRLKELEKTLACTFKPTHVTGAENDTDLASFSALCDIAAADLEECVSRVTQLSALQDSLAGTLRTLQDFKKNLADARTKYSTMSAGLIKRDGSKWKTDFKNRTEYSDVLARLSKSEEKATIEPQSEFAGAINEKVLKPRNEWLDAREQIREVQTALGNVRRTEWVDGVDSTLWGDLRNWTELEGKRNAASLKQLDQTLKAVGTTLKFEKESIETQRRSAADSIARSRKDLVNAITLVPARLIERIKVADWNTTRFLLGNATKVSMMFVTLSNELTACGELGPFAGFEEWNANAMATLADKATDSEAAKILYELVSQNLLTCRDRPTRGLWAQELFDRTVSLLKTESRNLAAAKVAASFDLVKKAPACVGVGVPVISADQKIADQQIDDAILATEYLIEAAKVAAKAGSASGECPDLMECRLPSWSSDSANKARQALELLLNNYLSLKQRSNWTFKVESFNRYQFNTYAIDEALTTPEIGKPVPLTAVTRLSFYRTVNDGGKMVGLICDGEIAVWACLVQKWLDSATNSVTVSTVGPEGDGKGKTTLTFTLEVAKGRSFIKVNASDLVAP